MKTLIRKGILTIDLLFGILALGYRIIVEQIPARLAIKDENALGVAAPLKAAGIME
jgi:hypothetical protein